MMNCFVFIYWAMGVPEIELQVLSLYAGREHSVFAFDKSSGVSKHK